jgi:hypothetical protein
MSVLWCGAEDVDFPNGSPITIDTGGTSYRTAYARCSLRPTAAGTYLKGLTFPGGPITSGWLRAYLYCSGGTSGLQMMVGFGKSGTNSGLGICHQNTSSTLHILSMNAGTTTALATVNNVFSDLILVRIDMQVINFGTTNTVNVYVNGAFTATYTGAISIPGVTNFDQVFIGDPGAGFCWLSEIIVSDESTLAWQGLASCAPSGNGTTQQWSNPAFTNFNPVTINDANSTFSNTVGQDEQATLVAIPAGNFQIKAVKVIARALATAGATATQVKLGFNNTNNATVAVGAAHALITGFSPVEDYFATDPTSAGGTGPWGTSLTGYQLDMRSN